MPCPSCSCCPFPDFPFPSKVLKASCCADNRPFPLRLTPPFPSLPCSNGRESMSAGRASASSSAVVLRASCDRIPKNGLAGSKSSSRIPPLSAGAGSLIAGTAGRRSVETSGGAAGLGASGGAGAKPEVSGAAAAGRSSRAVAAGTSCEVSASGMPDAAGAAGTALGCAAAASSTGARRSDWAHLPPT